MGYQVTVRHYTIGESNAAAWSQADTFGVTNLNKLMGQQEYAPFFIAGADMTGARYTQQPTTLLHAVSYKIINGSDAHPENDPGLFQPKTDTVLGPNGSLVTTYLQYSAPGKPSIIRDPKGNITWMVYEDGTSDGTTSRSGWKNGNLKYTIGSNGEGTESEYDDKGRVIATWRVTATGGSDTSLPTSFVRKLKVSSTAYWAESDFATQAEKDANAAVIGQVKSTTDELTGLTTSYTYYPDGRSKATFRDWTDGSGPYHVKDSETTYDSAGRTDKVYDANGNYTQSFYDALGQTIATRDIFGGYTINTYDSRGLLIRTYYPDHTETRTAYDDQGRAEWTSERFVSNQTLTFNPITGAISTTTSGSEPTYSVTRSIYDSAGRVTGTERYKDASITLGTVATLPETIAPSSATLLAAGKRLSKNSTLYDAQGRVAESVDATGLRTGTVYYANGQVKYSGILKSTAPSGGPYATADFTSYTEYKYDQQDSSTGRYYDRVIDANGHHTDTYKDALGRVIKTVFDDGSFTETLYGVDDSAIAGYEVTIPTGGSETVSINQRKTGDPVIATIRVSDAAGRLTDLYLPAVDDALTTSTALVRPHWHYTYDANGNELTQVDPKGHTTSFGYDVYNRRTSRTMPADDIAGQDTEIWEYYGSADGVLAGILKSHIDFKGQSTKYVYDVTASHGGRLIEEQRFTGAVDSTPDEKTVYGYDTLGRQSTATEFGNGNMAMAMRITTTSYDVITSDVSQIASPEGTIHYEYDPVTGRQLRVHTSNNDTSYQYDDRGRLWKVIATKLNGTVLATPQITTYTYDAVGNLDTITQPNGVVSDYDYDDLYRLDVLTVKKGTTTLFSQDYVLLNDGLRDSVHETRSDGSTLDIDWDYDAIGRLIKEDYNSSDNSTDFVATYKFDLNSNRVNKTQAGYQAAATDYEYNDRNELSSEITGSAETDYTYDANSSTLTKTTGSSTDSYGWDLRNRMTSATVSGSTTSYTYNNDDLRVSQTISSVKTVYLYDNANMTGYAKSIEELDAIHVVQTSYVLGLSVEAQSDLANGILNLIHDGSGTTRALTNTSGAVVEAYNNDAYGNAINYEPSTSKTTWHATDGREDCFTGLRYNISRDLDEKTGSWISEDKTIFGGGSWQDANLHLYVGANPNAGFDPLGLTNLLETEGAAAESNYLQSMRFPAIRIIRTMAGNQVIRQTLLNRILINSFAAFAGTSGGALGALYLYYKELGQQIAGHERAMLDALTQAQRDAVSSGRVRDEKEAEGLPVFYVFKTGPMATPEIWDNDAAALSGIGTSGGVKAPSFLNYLKGINDINRPIAIAWATGRGIVRGSGQSLDEYPFASVIEGGGVGIGNGWLRVSAVGIQEQKDQSRYIGSFYAANGNRTLSATFPYLVVLVP